jgi:2,3-dihydroxybenzoate-AMP ligase
LSQQEIARHKLPERLEVVDEFPLSPFGKVSKKDLAEDIAHKLDEKPTANLGALKQPG